MPFINTIERTGITDSSQYVLGTFVYMKPTGNCNHRLENSRLQMGRFEMPRFLCSELQRLD